jgi:hypothetical protein
MQNLRRFAALAATLFLLCFLPVMGMIVPPKEAGEEASQESTGAAATTPTTADPARSRQAPR